MTSHSSKVEISFSRFIGRARMLARLNRRNQRERYHPDYRKWAELARNEALSGNTQHWAPRSRLEILKDRLADLEGRPLRQRVASDIAAVRAELVAAQRERAA